ncbi:MAG TPA: tetratricopeptide repeat protein [Spirochaetota bacterium]|nr:tetratricopeptide repeat protein [Spirochaetota bacterium]
MDDINNILNTIKKTALNDLFAGDLDSAIDELKRAEMIDRENPEILFNLGIVYCRKGLYKTAHDYFKQVLLLRTSFINAAVVKKNIAFCLIQNEIYEEALSYLNEVITDFKSDIHALNMRGYCLEKKGELKEALKAYREIFRYDRSNINSLNSTSYLMASLGIELNSALKIAKFVYQKNKLNPAYNDTIGYVYLKLGNYKEAEKHLKSAASMLPFNKEISGHIKELNKLKK